MRLVGDGVPGFDPAAPDPAAQLLAKLKAAGKDTCAVCRGPIAFAVISATDPARAADFGLPPGATMTMTFGLCARCEVHPGRVAVVEALIANHIKALTN